MDNKVTSRQLTFGKEEKLKSRKLINDLFQSGTVVKSYPIRIHYMVSQGQQDYFLKTGVSVSKRNFKRAVDRNKIKRQLREAYRLHSIDLKDALTNHGLQLCMMIIYTDRKFTPTQQIESKVSKCIDKIVCQLPELK